MNVKVDIVHGSLHEAGKAVVLCTFFFDGQTVSCTSETFLKLARSIGAIGNDGATYFPKDGMPFMRALANLYHGPHLVATAPIEI